MTYTGENSARIICSYWLSPEDADVSIRVQDHRLNVGDAIAETHAGGSRVFFQGAPLFRKAVQEGCDARGCTLVADTSYQR
jgi:hypothetical protein